MINVRELFEGILLLKLGKPEKFTPMHFKKIKPDIEKIKVLDRGETTFDINKISYSITAQGCQIRLPLKAEEDIYGFGLQLKSFNHVGKKRCIRPNADPKADSGDSHAPVPFYLSSNGYGIFVDTARHVSFYCGTNKKNGESKENAIERRATLVYTEEDLYVPSKPEEERTMLIEIPAVKGVNIYLFNGPDILTALRRYILFSGSGCLPPLWGLGIWYRSFAGNNCDQNLELAKQFREQHLPCDVLGLEPGWQSYSYPCSYTWDVERGQGYNRFIAKVKTMGYRLNLWEHAFVHPTAEIYSDIQHHSGEWEVWGGVVPDFATKEAREIFSQYHKNKLAEQGIDSFKLDECDGSDFTGGWSFPNSTMFPSGIDGEQMHSMFGVLYQQVIDGIYKQMNKRAYHLVRNSHGLASSYPFVLYSDLYDHKEFIRGIVNSGFCGLLWTPEVRHANSVKDLIRRIQTVVFSPQALVNAWYCPNPPWYQVDHKLNKEGMPMKDREKATELVRRLFELRMKLLPYLYSSFVKYYKEGIPLFRAMVLDWPNDQNCRKIDDQYMMGDSILVAPLTEQSDLRKVYIPEGEWFCFWSHKKYENGWHEVECSLEQMPVFVKKNTILPLAKPVEFVTKDTIFELEPVIYGDSPDPCVLYEDDGETYNIDRGFFNRVQIDFDEKRIRMTRQGAFVFERYSIKSGG